MELFQQEFGLDAASASELHQHHMRIKSSGYVSGELFHDVQFDPGEIVLGLITDGVK